MSTLRISDAPLLPDVDGTEKIPTGGRGDYAISVDQIKGHIFEDVGKELVGLGNVDNTSDLDKPVSTAQQAALNLKADKTYVDANLDLKADKTNVYTRSETTLALSTKADLVGGVIPSNQLPSYVDDVVEYTTNTLPIIGESGKIYITTDTNRTWRWSGNQYVEISNGGVSDSTLKLQTPRKIANVDFDGTQNIDVPHNNLVNRNVEGAHTANSINTLSGENQQEVNDFGGAKWRSKVSGYEVGATVKLDNGDVVKSTIANNTVNPNVDMNGWFNESKFVEDKTKSFLDFGAKGDGESDDSISIGLASTWSSIYKRKVSGLGKTYKCSNVFFDSHCHLVDAKLINNKDEDLISVLTTTISSDWLENVVFEDIHINGVRQDARTIKSTVTSEDGGRHGFRFRRPCRNIWIIRSSANYCASDGLCIFPDYSGGLFESVQNFNVIDSEFLWNRRHGGSNDRTNGINFTNVKCKYNGLPLSGGSGYPATDGRNGDTFNGNYYGNGWDSEEYDDTTISQNMTFINCDMTGNARGGLLILATANVTTPTTPTNIKVLGGKYDKGVYNTDDNAAILITPNGLSNVNPIYTNTVIDAVSTTDNILLRNNVNFSVTNTPCFLAVSDRSSGFADKKIRGQDIAPTSSLNTPDGTPFGMFTYDAATGTKTVVDYQITHNMFNDGQSKYQDFRVGAFKFGQIETKVDSATNSTTWTWKTGADVERFRVGRYGVQLHVPDAVPDSELKNQGLVFELVSNTQLKIKVKGGDGVVRSTTLTLA